MINISWAANIDQAALLATLEGRRLGSATLDVLEGEPPLNPRFMALDNVLLQPHHGPETFETRKAIGCLLQET